MLNCDCKPKSNKNKVYLIKIFFIFIISITYLTCSGFAQQNNINYETVSLDSIANSPLDHLTSPPYGNVIFSGVPFSINREFVTQDQIATSRPTQGTLSVNIPAPYRIYILLNGGYVLNTFQGRKVGDIVFQFDDGTSYEKSIIAGEDIRETWSASGTITHITGNPTFLNVISNSQTRGSQSATGYMDRYTIDLPSQFQSRTLRTITIYDTSLSDVGSYNPALVLQGITVETYPQPTTVPTTYPTSYPTTYSQYSTTTAPTAYPTNPTYTSTQGSNESSFPFIAILVLIGVIGFLGYVVIQRKPNKQQLDQNYPTPPSQVQKTPEQITPPREDPLIKIQPHIDLLIKNQPKPLESIEKFYSFLELEGFTLTPELKNKIVKKIREARDERERTIKKQQISSELFESKKEKPEQTLEKIPTPSPVDQFTPRPVTPKQLPQDLSDRYTESEFIGKGGFARVFKAKRKGDGKLIAVKIPISLDASTGKTFIAEMQNWTKLSHPNIVKLYDFNIMPLPYFEEELCDGSLADQKKPMECEEAAWILFNVCEGIKFAHSHKIIHRDLKPQNILLKNGVPKISDWGLSRIISESTSTSVASFTPHYASPEQIGGKPKDERTDIWQLGVILYELITGTLPFTGESMIEIGMSIASKDPKIPSEIQPDAKALDAVVIKCLQKEPANRYQSVLELQKDLALYLRKNYAELLKTSITAKDFQKSQSYCGDLVMINLLTGDISTAYKYLIDLTHYAQDDVRKEVQELSEQIKIRMEMGITEIPDELIQKAEIIVHRVRLGF